MAKKPKVPTNSTVGNIETSEPDSSDIFKTLFGNRPEEDTSVSIFSDSNPFKRKSVPGEAAGTPGSFSDTPKENKRRRSNLEVPEVKKSKNPNLGDSGSDDADRKNPVSGGESKDMGLGDNGLRKEEEKKKKKKKRKRDEIEAEYERLKYGAKGEIEEEGVSGGVNVGEKRKKSDTAEDMLVTKEGFDDEDKLLRTVFVGNLPLKIKKKALLREFSQFGEIESVRLRSVPLLDEKMPRKGAIMKKKINDAVDRVNAYVVFKMEESAKASLLHNMAIIGGNHIHVDRACPPRKKLKGDNAPLYDNKRTVFVGNLPFDVKDEELYQLFTGINNKSSIEAVRVIRDSGTSMGKGIAYVLFNTREAASMVVRKHNLKLRDRVLRLSRATTNTTPSKRKETFPADKFNSPSKRMAVGTTTPGTRSGNKSTSYQGIRASKSGVEKKSARKFSSPVFSESKVEKGGKQKERTGKRPAVAARKAAAKARLAVGGAATKKRKPENRTPQSSNRNKKARISR